MNQPFDEVCRECLLGEVPVSVDERRHFHGVSCWEDGYLKHSTCIDEDLPSQGVYVDCVAEMRLQKLVYRVERAQLSVGCNHKWLNHRVSVQPAHSL